MVFSPESLLEMQAQLAEVGPAYHRLMHQYFYYPYQSERGAEFAHHGFSRRLNTLKRCIENIFEQCPPDRDDLPSNDQLTDVTIQLQSFVFNVFGAIDNLAWIWVCERNILSEKGKPLPNSKVGFGKNCEIVYASFSEEFRDYLDGLKEWFEVMEGYRHALAHRIPLYVPPYVVSEDVENRHQELTREMDAAIREGRIDDYDRFSAEQKCIRPLHPHDDSFLLRAVQKHILSHTSTL